MCGDTIRKLRAKPVVFGGVDWTSRAKLGLQPRPTPREKGETRLAQLRECLPNIDWMPLCEIDSPGQINQLVEGSRDADMVLALASELLVVKTAARALAAVRCPVALIGQESQPTAVFCDVYRGLWRSPQRGVAACPDARHQRPDAQGGKQLRHPTSHSLSRAKRDGPADAGQPSSKLPSRSCGTELRLGRITVTHQMKRERTREQNGYKLSGDLT